MKRGPEIGSDHFLLEVKMWIEQGVEGTKII